MGQPKSGTRGAGKECRSTANPGSALVKRAGEASSIRRLLTTPSSIPRLRWSGELRDAGDRPRGQGLLRTARCRVPKSWSQNATNIVAQKYFPASWLRRPRAVGPADDRPRSRHDLDLGARPRYFASDDDAAAFEAELTHILLHQLAAFQLAGLVQRRFRGEPAVLGVLHPQRQGRDGIDPRLEPPGGEDLPRRVRVGDQPVEDPRLDGAAFQGRQPPRAGQLHARRRRLAARSSPAQDPAGGKDGGARRRPSGHPDFIWCKAKEEDKAGVARCRFDMSIDGEASTRSSTRTRTTRCASARVHASDRERRRLASDRTRHRRARREADPRRQLMKEIAEAAVAMRRSRRPVRHHHQPVAHLPGVGRINASNPCSEYMHVDDSACNLPR